MNVVSQIREVNVMTFPVLTFSLLRKDGKFMDEDFAKWACRHNMKWADSNFYISDNVTSLSNCCFAGNQMIYIRVNKSIKVIPFRKAWEKYSELSSAHIQTLIGGKWMPARLVKSTSNVMYHIVTADGREIDASYDHLFPTHKGEKMSCQLAIGDYLKVDVAYDSKKPKAGIATNDADTDVRYKEIVSIDIRRGETQTFCFQMEDQSIPYFTLQNGVIVHNCRLVSNIDNLGFFNSIGGSALEVGSVKVNTINLARIAYGSDETEYLSKLAEYVEGCCKLLTVQRGIIARNVEKGLLPNYAKGLMHIENQYSTIGIIGLYEAMQHYGSHFITKDEFGYTFYTEAGMAFAKAIMDTIIQTKKQYEDGFQINIEQIPGERAASVLMEKDRLFHPDEKYELPLYGNQFIPLGVKCTLHEKIRVSAVLDKACSGGSISHINIDTPFTDFDTAWRMLNYCADQGVVYFAFCTRISACEKNHGFYGETCPICGGKKVTTYQRVVGFLTPERSYSTARKAEFKLRDWFDVNRMEEI